MSTLAQRSFAAGEIAPALWPRTDQTKYQTGLMKCRNFLVPKYGGVSNRPGGTFDGEVSDSSKVVRLIPFVFNVAQTYVLEFGDLYMRVHHNGGQVLEAAKAITGLTAANPGVITIVGHGYVTGDEIAIANVGGMTRLNGRNFKVVKIGNDTFSLKYMDGTVVNTTGFSAWTAGGTCARVYTIVTPYAAADLGDLIFTESADVVTLTNTGYAVQELKRTADTNWTIAPFTAAAKIARPLNCLITPAGAGTPQYRVKVTAVAANGEESLAGLSATTKNITAITQANPAVVTSVAHGYVNGDVVFIQAVGGMTQVNGKEFLVANKTNDTFQLQDTDSTAFGAYTAGGTLNLVSCTQSGSASVVTWDLVVGAISYNLYIETSGIYGFFAIMGLSRSYTFPGSIPLGDTTDTPPLGTNPFPGANDYPACVGYGQQRLCFGQTKNNPETFYGSETGSFHNFDTHTPIKDSDPVQFIIAGREVNAIKHIIDLGKIIVFTQSGEWSIAGDASGVLTPKAINARQHSYEGASRLRPLIVGANAVFVQARGSLVRDLGWDWQVDGYRGNDLSIFSAHLVDGHSLVDWTYAKIPNSIIWAAREDGVLIGLTYIREQQMWAWHRHDFDGTVENVCAVPEGGEDALYLVIKRTVNGRSVRYIERFATRQVLKIVDSIFTDCSLSYDGRNDDLAETMTISGGTTWANGEALTVTASTPEFLASDVGNAVFITSADGLTIIRCTITAFTSTTVVTVSVDKTVPVAMRTVALNSWSKAVTAVSGLWHLEGKAVSVFADGFVVANPNNANYTTVLTVTNGAITLPQPYAVIHVGLPVTADIETLDIDLPGSESIADKKKNVGKVTAFLQDSRGLWVGASDPGSDSSLDGLEEMRVRGLQDETQDQPVALATGKVEIPLRPEWNSQGHVFMRVTDPVPVNILAVMPAGYFPINAGGGR